MKTTMRLRTFATASLLAVWFGPASGNGFISETEPNHPIDQAQRVVSSSGQAAIDGILQRWNLENDVDFFSFHANEGEVLSVDIDNGYAVGNSVDTIVAIFENSPGYPMLRLNDDARPIDPGSRHRYDSRIDSFRAPATGEYIVGVSSYPRYFRSGGSTSNGYYFDDGDYDLIITGIAPSVLQINIDVKPGNDGVAPLNPKSKGKIPVAVLSSDTFDALSVDKDSIRFGHGGDEKSLHKCNWKGEDVNGDGRLDLMCHFYNQTAGFRKGDLEAVLKGTTKPKGNAKQGTAFEGRAYLKVVPEKARP